MPRENKKETLSNSNNKTIVLQLIRSGVEITRADIIEKSGLSAPTVTRIIEDLLERQLIVQDEVGSSKGGRPPQIIRFEAKRNYVIGVDISGDYVRAALSNLDGEFSYEIHLPVNIEGEFDGVMLQVGELIQKLEHRAQTKQYRLFGIGIAICGLVSKQTGLLRYSPVFDWKDKDILKALKSYSDLPMEMENVSHLIALGESLYGVGREYDSMINVNLDYGIGSGIIINGQPFYGSQGFAGELGHIVLDSESKRKGKENISGTFEAVASGYALTDIARERLAKVKNSALSKISPSMLDAKAIIHAAEEGDKLAGEIVNTLADYTGISLDILIKLFNPDAITLSGGLIDHGNLLLNKVKEKVQSISLPIYESETPIVPSTFGEEAALMGAFSLILQKILKLE
ncbi:MAG: ROK family protein [Cyclobacteriaceae bacterium]